MADDAQRDCSFPSQSEKEDQLIPIPDLTAVVKAQLARQIQHQGRAAPSLPLLAGQGLHVQDLMVQGFPEGLPSAGVVPGQAEDLSGPGHAAYDVMHSRHGQHVRDAGNAPALRGDQSCLRPVQQKLSRGQLPRAQLILEL